MSVDTDVWPVKDKRNDILDKQKDSGNNYDLDLNNNTTGNKISENIERK